MSEERAERRLAAILAADVAGYSRLMENDEEGTLAVLKAIRREMADPKIAEHRGRIVKTTGDGMLVEFASVVDAVRCAAEIQRAMVDRNAEISEDRRIQFRIGVNLGDVIVDDSDIFGDGVNIAARLEALAAPGGICISGTVREHVGDRLPYTFEDIGAQSVKNLARPVRVFALSAGAVAVLPRVPNAGEIKPAAMTTAPRLSIVVLPFANLSSDPEQEYFADAVTDDVTTDLSRIHDSFVISRTTAFTYKGKAVDAKQIGRDLSVRYVLEGSVRRLGEQVQINVQLIDAETGAHIWADRFNTSRIDLETAEDEITTRLASALHLELVEAVGRRIEQEQAANLDARDFCMRGWAWHHRPVSATQLQEAERAFEQALVLDPGSADAKAGIALVMLNAGVVGVRTRDLGRCERLLNEALERDAHHARSLIAMGWVRQLQERFLESRILLEKAIALDRNSAGAQVRLGFTLQDMGECEPALPHFERAVQLSPRDPNQHWYYNGLGTCHLNLGNLDMAIEFLLKARSGNPRIYEFPLWLAAAYGLHGDFAEATGALAAFHELKPDITSLAKLRAFAPRLFKSNLQAVELREKTWMRGLRLAGLPEE
jgi:adenylate cyclase